jgi:hypothetical protein
VEARRMIDINEAPNKTATALERFLEPCGNEEPYIQNIWMAARHLVTVGLGHFEYQTQYSSGTTLWKPECTYHTIPRIPYQPRKPRIVINLWKGLVDSIISDSSINVDVLVEDNDGDKTEFQEREVQVDPEKVAETFAAAERNWKEEERNDNKP